MTHFSRRVLAKSGALLGLAHGLETALPFVRNIVLARFLEPREFALALTLAAIVGMAEMMSDIGLPQYALRAGIENSRFRATLHSLTLIRCCLSGALVGCAAYPLSLLVEFPGSEWSFALVGGAVALRGFVNLAVKQAGRDGRFAPEAIALIASQIVWTVAVVILSIIWRNHWAMAVSLVLSALTLVVATNLVQHVPFRLAWDRAVVADAIRYGRPLIPNGVALAITSLSDRLILSGLRGLEVVATYAPLVTMAMLPRGTALRYVYNLVLPTMVRRHQSGTGLDAVNAGWLAIVSLLAAVFGLGFISLAGPVIVLVFGERYAPAPALSILMGALLTCRIVIAYPVPIAMAYGRTWFVAGSSMVSAAAMLPAGLALAAGPADPIAALTVFLGSLVIVETLGAALVLWRARRAFPETTASMLRSAILVICLVYGVGLLCQIAGWDHWTERLAPCAIALIVSAAAFVPAILIFLRIRSDS